MEAILNNLIKATGWSIFHSLWQGAIIYGILLLIILIFPKLRSRLKHNLAFAAICLIFICYGITFFSVFKLPVAMEIKNNASISLTPVYYQYLSSLPQQISNVTERFFPYIVGVYSIGLLFQFFILAMGYKRMQNLKNSVHFAVPAAWKTSFEQLTLALNLRQHIGFYLSDQINVPLVIGYFKPVVLFPISLATQLDMDQVEAILIHELSHIRRNDYLLNLVKTGIETLLFFNPFIWLSGKFINIEREHACDDLVLKFTGNPMTYARALLQLEILKDKSSPAFSMAATGKNQHLYQRIKRITDMKTNYMNVRQQMFAITLAIATVISLAWVKPSKTEKTTTKTSKETRIEVAGLSISQIPTPVPIPKVPKTPSVPKAPSLNIPELPEPPCLPNGPHAPAAPIPPIPPKHMDQDTTKKKSKQRIIIVDEKGHKKTYKSVKEMPESERERLFNETYGTDLNYDLNINIDSIVNKSISFLKSPEWKKSMAQISSSAHHVESYFNSKDWKKQQDEIQKNAESISNYFKSKEWKKQEENIRRNAETIERKINSKEFKRGMEEAKRASKEQEAAEKKP